MIQEFLSSIASKIITGIVGVGLIIGGFFGMNQVEQKFSAVVPTVIASFSTTLAAEITSTATTMTLTSGTTDDSTTLNGTYGFVIDSGVSGKEEFVLASCTDTACTSMTRGVSSITGNTAVTALKHAHSRGASVKISDHPQLAIISRIINADETFPNGATFGGNVSITGTVSTTSLATFGGKATYKNTETINDDKDLASKAYVDSAAASGAPNMSLTAKGIGEEATAAEINAGTQTGSTSAELIVNPKYLKDAIYYTQLPTSDEKAALAGTGTPSSGNKYCTADYPIPISYLDTTTTLGTSDTKVPSQKAVKTYVDATPPSSTNGVITRAGNAGAGAVTTAHGLGRTPKMVRVSAIYLPSTHFAPAWSTGSYNGTTNACNFYTASVQTALVTYDAVGGSTTYAIYVSVANAAGTYAQRGVITVDATNITITWSLPAGGALPDTNDIQISWEAN